MAHAKEPSLNERLLHALILVLLIMMTGSKNPKSFVLAHRIVRSNRICDPIGSAIHLTTLTLGPAEHG